MPPKPRPAAGTRTILIENESGQAEPYDLKPGEGGHDFVTSDGRSVHCVGDRDGRSLYRILRPRTAPVKPMRAPDGPPPVVQPAAAGDGALASLTDPVDDGA